MPLAHDESPKATQIHLVLDPCWTLVSILVVNQNLKYSPASSWPEKGILASRHELMALVMAVDMIQQHRSQVASFLQLSGSAPMVRGNKLSCVQVSGVDPMSVSESLRLTQNGRPTDGRTASFSPAMCSSSNLPGCLGTRSVTGLDSVRPVCRSSAKTRSPTLICSIDTSP